jgi:hypothetical protein
MLCTYASYVIHIKCMVLIDCFLKLSCNELSISSEILTAVVILLGTEGHTFKCAGNILPACHITKFHPLREPVYVITVQAYKRISHPHVNTRTVSVI